DFNQLRQVLVNLINNAAQSLAELDAGQGVVRIVLGHSANGVSLAVADNGPGLSQDDLDRIFDPFYTTKGESGGTGLGLSIARGIVEEHGGRITVTAELGAGAKFTVELPEYRGKSEHSGRAKAIVLDDDATLDVLVVDDEPHILHYMRATLEAWGHSVRVAESGGAALERISEREPDIVITDIRMPELSGRSLYDEIVRRNKALSHRVIFSTGDTMRDDTLKFLESLERPYLRKPFTLNRLKSVLAQVAEA
ncbi:MAG: ATP-binding protein, partial [Gemmatimonadales bacterium]